ncbi:hypothetical protein ACHAWF_008889 [Thalassiosira exigua]
MDSTGEVGGDKKNDANGHHRQGKGKEQEEEEQQQQQQPQGDTSSAEESGPGGMMPGMMMMGGPMPMGAMPPHMQEMMSMAMGGHTGGGGGGGFFMAGPGGAPLGSPFGLGMMSPLMMGVAGGVDPGAAEEAAEAAAAMAASGVPKIPRVSASKGSGKIATTLPILPTWAPGDEGDERVPKNGKKAGLTLAGGPAKRKKRSGSAASEPVAEAEDPPIVLETEGWRRDVLDRHPRCKSAEGIRETSFFETTSKGRSAVASAPAGGGGRRYRSRRGGGGAGGGGGGVGNLGCLRRLLAELNKMEYEDGEQLPGGAAPIWLRYDDETPQYLRAVITGPPRNTPYSNGLFVFDIYIPSSYPSAPPLVQLLTTGGGTVKFSPNLYETGRVCLSLLNTWSGPKWDPGQSSILQILVSIQGLIMGVEHPYYMEPGYGGWEGKAGAVGGIGGGGGIYGKPYVKIKVGKKEASGSGATKPGAAKSGAASGKKAHAPSDGGGGAVKEYVPYNVRRYDDTVRAGTLKYAIAEHLRDLNRVRSQGAARPHYLSAFEDIIQAHFLHRKECILADGRKWSKDASTSTQKRMMQATLKDLESLLEKLEATASDPTAAGSSPADTKVAAAQKAAAPKLPSNDASATSPEITAKRNEMEDAAAKGDYITAGRIQAELEVSAKVNDMLIARRKEMDAAAEKKDYVTAGKLQLIVIHLDRNKRRLQDLERRMFESAAKQDFVKAGRFQEQYRILLESADVKGGTTPAVGTAQGSSSTHGPASDLGGAIASALMGSGGGFHSAPVQIKQYQAPSALTPPGDGAYDDPYGYYPDDYGDY